MPSVTRPPSAAHARRDAVERRVLSAVEILLDAGHSYTELPVQRIASEAGIARSTFYAHFPDKTQLLLKLARHPTGQLFAAAERWWQGDHRGGAAGAAEAVAEMITVYRSNERVLSAVMEVAGYEPDVATVWRIRVDTFIGLVRGRLEELQQAGAVSPELDPAPTAALLTRMVERSITQHVPADGGTGDVALAGALGRSIWLTVYGDTGSSG